MRYHRLQRHSVSFFAFLRSLNTKCRRWLQARPTLGDWVYPQFGDNPESDYRDFNAWYFTSFFEQERMLADQPRMNFYHAAITRHIQPGDRVIDLGTGTGILAAFASRRGAKQVYAIDHSPILATAKALALANGIQNVDFISTHSTKFSLTEKVDVILHEQMGDCLFDESMVANITDLRDRLLKPGGLILPSLFELYCEPITTKDEFRIPFIWELNVHGYDYSSLEKQRPQEPGYYNLRSGDRGLIRSCLGTPEPLLTVDLHTLKETDLPRDIHFKRVVTTPGRLDGYAVYFKARVGQDLMMTTDPLNTGRAPHWGFRILRTEDQELEMGDVLEVTLTVDRWNDIESWRWKQVKHSAATLNTPEPSPSHAE